MEIDDEIWNWMNSYSNYTFLIEKGKLIAIKKEKNNNNKYAVKTTCMNFPYKQRELRRNFQVLDRSLSESYKSREKQRQINRFVRTCFRFTKITNYQNKNSRNQGRYTTPNVYKKQYTINSKIYAYCFTCKRKTRMISPRKMKAKNGRIATQGRCQVCGNMCSTF